MAGKITSPAAQNRGATATKAHAISHPSDIVPIIREIQASGITTAYGIAAALNLQGVPTVRSGAFWQAIQVQRILAKLA